MTQFFAKHRFALFVAAALTIGHIGSLFSFVDLWEIEYIIVMWAGMILCGSIFFPMAYSPRFIQDRLRQVGLGVILALLGTAAFVSLVTLFESGEPVAGFGLGLGIALFLTVIGPDSWIVVVVFVIGSAVNIFQKKRAYRAPKDDIRDIFS
jgi:hypothetical protein